MTIGKIGDPSGLITRLAAPPGRLDELIAENVSWCDVMVRLPELREEAKYSESGRRLSKDG